MENVTSVTEVKRVVPAPQTPVSIVQSVKAFLLYTKRFFFFNNFAELIIHKFIVNNIN